MDILDIINEATKEADAFENHAAKELTLEERLLYLQGLALVMNVDGDIHEEEKEYIRILIKSFDMDESTLNDFVAFAQSPDKDTVQAFFKTYRRRPIAQLFLFDALMMSRRDGKVDERENAIIDSLADKLEILKGIQEDIFDLFCYIKNRNWRESALYFNSHLLNPDHFKHLLAYHELDYDQLMKETASLRGQRILQAIKKKMPPLTPGEKVKPELNHEIVIPMLQAELDRGNASVNGGVFLVDDDLGKVEIKLKNYGLEYSKEYNFIFKQPGADFGKVGQEVVNRLINTIGINTAEEVIDILYDSKVKVFKAKLSDEDPRLIKTTSSVEKSLPYLKLEGRFFTVEANLDTGILSSFSNSNFYLSDAYSSKKSVLYLQQSVDNRSQRGCLRELDIDSLLKRVFFKGLPVPGHHAPK
ncbi:TerB family tellurite resistance protein [Marinobacter sp. ANT_B65]|uniref:tellurite resistance TerB family protein n=1 Tax=Marinobacter sp. ANT_B65 TaxID=2039467 RepID=UPI000BBEB74A|nr:TerB family tellurite resistance protein [Marinobacter sp. ANT_B65]PCM45929.1 hypothetical protein CPA50_08215 [Marinobacter sp. ANT_B65]